MANQVWHSPYDASEMDGAFQTFNNTAQEYSASSTYALHDLVLHEKKLYQCNTTISTAEAWNPAHWEQTTLASLVSSATGDMLQAQYDPNSTVKNYGGIEAYSEKKGFVTIGNTQYTATRKPLVITNDGVTTTYYLCDIT